MKDEINAEKRRLEAQRWLDRDNNIKRLVKQHIGLARLGMLNTLEIVAPGAIKHIHINYAHIYDLNTTNTRECRDLICLIVEDTKHDYYLPLKNVFYE